MDAITPVVENDTRYHLLLHFFYHSSLLVHWELQWNVEHNHRTKAKFQVANGRYASDTGNVRNP